MKKAQSLSINTIIIAILGMLVLVILIFIIVRNIQNLNDTTESCAAKTGSIDNCKPKSPGCNPVVGEVQITNVKDCGTDKVCCMPLLTQE